MTVNNHNRLDNKDLDKTSDLFERVVDILEQARGNVVRAVNVSMVTAYWLIGREIVQEAQDGQDRAEYGKQIISKLSEQLTSKYGKGYSVVSLKNYRLFYQVYSDRITEKSSPSGSQLKQFDSKSFPLGSQLSYGFSSQLSWSHYRALMRINKSEAREFYEQQAIECAWNKRTLERHIQSQFFERMIVSQHPQKMLESAKSETKTTLPEETLKNPYVLEFLGLPDIAGLHETKLEAAIITHLQEFLLELGKGFAFESRQKRMRYDETDYYVDLVFYNYILKCHVLIDLKIGELTHQDVGQMDGYVRMFDDLYVAKDDNPTIGLILCTEKNESVARYSVLKDRKQIFASKYMLYLPTEEELALELKKERYLIEQQLEQKKNITE